MTRPDESVQNLPGTTGPEVESIILSTDEQNQILLLQQSILEAVARGGDALSVAQQVCSLEEQLLPNSLGSVMLLDENRELLNVFAAPSAPPEGIASLNGLRPGPGGGSCGNAVFSGQPQFVQNTFTDPRWADIRQVAYDFGLCSCWSMPIFTASGQVIGSFALSSFEHRLPSNFHRKLLEIGASIVGIVLDRARDQEALRLKNEQLQRSYEDMEKFAYVASHDLQTPLRNMVHFAQLLERRYKGALDAEADEFIRHIVDGGKRMTYLVRDLLEYSRASGSISEIAPVDAGSALRTARDNLADYIARHRVEIVAGELPWVIAEQTLLVDLFQNLIHNAIKYRAKDRRPRINISCVRQDAETWHFTVGDNGIGIETQYFDKIFELFQRLDPDQHPDGTGIGLSLCRRLVHRFGGEIWVDSMIGEGSTFHFTLPAAPAA